jgi:hypothetical protein
MSSRLAPASILRNNDVQSSVLNFLEASDKHSANVKQRSVPGHLYNELFGPGSIGIPRTPGCSALRCQKSPKTSSRSM